MLGFIKLLLSHCASLTRFATCMSQQMQGLHRLCNRLQRRMHIMYTAAGWASAGLLCRAAYDSNDVRTSAASTWLLQCITAVFQHLFSQISPWPVAGSRVLQRTGFCVHPTYSISNVRTPVCTYPVGTAICSGKAGPILASATVWLGLQCFTAPSVLSSLHSVTRPNPTGCMVQQCVTVPIATWH